MPVAFQWARLKSEVKCPLRKGAWYRILKLTPMEAVLDVRGKPVTVARGHLQLAPTPALRWTVVPSPTNAPRFPTSWGSRYAVCPNCRERAPLEGRAPGMRCQRCNSFFEIAWDEPNRAAG
ncbi:MAG TPA: hypothetical protein VM736_06605 [Gemmatimonadales bacterium]|nr:hypothetical protein [Gemmatimonadales bacterium]